MCPQEERGGDGIPQQIAVEQYQSDFFVDSVPSGCIKQLGVVVTTRHGPKIRFPNLKLLLHLRARAKGAHGRHISALEATQAA